MIATVGFLSQACCVVIDQPLSDGLEEKNEEEVHNMWKQHSQGTVDRTTQFILK